MEVLLDGYPAEVSPAPATDLTSTEGLPTLADSGGDVAAVTPRTAKVPPWVTSEERFEDTPLLVPPQSPPNERVVADRLYLSVGPSDDVSEELRKTAFAGLVMRGAVDRVLEYSSFDTLVEHGNSDATTEDLFVWVDDVNARGLSRDYSHPRYTFASGQFLDCLPRFKRATFLFDLALTEGVIAEFMRAFNGALGEFVLSRFPAMPEGPYLAHTLCSPHPVDWEGLERIKRRLPGPHLDRNSGEDYADFREIVEEVRGRELLDPARRMQTMFAAFDPAKNQSAQDWPRSGDYFL
ncbi:hypothetical protein [Actinacidiphila glaucinigra]|uniref:hypothetical protein n=1 Tax=Actinacidiphila glaucinigra TaxID=235986 RepID=UPI00366ABB28